VFIPLVDILRCVNAHEETWLVASIERSENRFIVEGTLGCPICLAEYPIRDGVVFFAERARTESDAQPSESEAVRLAAALNLTEPRMTAVLHGKWGTHAHILRGIAPAQVILLNPPLGVASGDGVSLIVSDAVPFAQRSVDAAAFDASVSLETSDSTLVALQRSLRQNGRMLADGALVLPDGLTELARDDDVWVAQLDVAPSISSPVPLQRRGR
jgi:uncharacterized protein YbaR (Trm112 family)